MRNLSVSILGLSFLLAACGSTVEVLGTSGAGGGSAATSSGPGGAGGSGGTGTTTTVTTSSASSGGGTTCAGLGDDCTTCISEQCADAWCACTANAECAPMLTCLALCEGQPDCFPTCSQAHAFGVGDALAVTVCGGQKCVGSCDWASGVEDPCTACFATKCEEETNGCFGDKACTDLYQCLVACESESCAQGCLQAHAGGFGKFQSWYQCAFQECMNECGG